MTPNLPYLLAGGSPGQVYGHVRGTFSTGSMSLAKPAGEIVFVLVVAFALWCLLSGSKKKKTTS